MKTFSLLLFCAAMLVSCQGKEGGCESMRVKLERDLDNALADQMTMQEERDQAESELKQALEKIDSLQNELSTCREK